MHAMNLIATWGFGKPILRRKVADVDDGSEPTKVIGRNFRRGRRVKVHAEVWSLRKSVCSCTIRLELFGFVYQDIESISRNQKHLAIRRELEVL